MILKNLDCRSKCHRSGGGVHVEVFRNYNNYNVEAVTGGYKAIKTKGFEEKC